MNKDSKKIIIDLFIDFDDWLQTPTGAYVRAWEQKYLDVLTADIFGFNAVQIGLPRIDALHANRMPYRWLTNICPSVTKQVNKEIPLVAAHNFSELPFATQSLDLVILPHVLEFSTQPHQVLREVERVLIPEGQVIICGFNQTSLWGICQACRRLTGANFFPYQKEFIYLPRLKDWLKLLNMEIKCGHFCCYAPPCTSEKWLYRFAFMEKAGDRWWPYFGAVYIIQAIKRAQRMCLINPILDKKNIKAPQGLPIINCIH